MIIRNWGISKPIECCKLCDVVPDLSVVGMENVCAVFVDVNAFNGFGVHISSDIRALVNDNNTLAYFFRFVCEDCSI